jgi:hypothetical protein
MTFRPVHALPLAGLLALAFISTSADAAKAKKKKPAAAAELPPFDKDAAGAALGSVEISHCKKPGGPSGDGHVVVTFSPSGSAAAAYADTAPYLGTPVGKCVESAYGKARIPAFKGDPVNVGKRFKLP